MFVCAPFGQTSILLNQLFVLNIRFLSHHLESDQSVAGHDK